MKHSMDTFRIIISVVVALGILTGFLWLLGGGGQDLPQVRAATLDVCGSCTYQTIQEAIDNANPEDTIRVASGTYSEAINIPVSVTLIGGYNASWVYNPDAHPTIIDRDYAGQLIEMTTSGLSVTLQGLTLQRGRDPDIYSGHGSNVHSEGAQVLISDCVVLSGTVASAGLGGAGLHLDNGDYSRIVNTLVQGNDTRHAIYIDGGNHTKVENVTVTQNTGGGILFNASDYSSLVDAVVSHNGTQGVYIRKSNDYLILARNLIAYNTSEGVYFENLDKDTLLSQNEVRGNGQTGIHLETGIEDSVIEDNTIVDNGQYGVFFGDRSHNNFLRDNLVVGNVAGGVYILKSTGQELDNNIIVDNAGPGVKIAGELIVSPADATLRHNTLVSNAVGGVEVGVESDVALINNIIATHTVGILTQDRTARAEAEYTLWFGNNRNSSSPGGGEVETTNDLTGDPLFEGGSDVLAAYHIQAGSAAIDAGVNTGLGVDIDGQNRAAPDIGVDEFDYALRLTPEYRETVLSGAEVTYTHYLTNTGSTTQTFNLTVSPVISPDWSQELAPAGSVVLSSGAQATVVLTVTVPGSAVRGDVDKRWITASVQGHAESYKQVEDVTLVEVGVDLSPGRSEYAIPSLPNTSIRYTHTITNIGEETDSFTVALGSLYGWATVAPTEVTNLAAAATGTLTITVVVPYTAAAGLVEHTHLTVTSHFQPEGFDTAQNSTPVSPTNGTRYVAQTAGATDALNNCLLDTYPCQTLWKAVQQAQGGDTVKIATGVYTDARISEVGMLAWIRENLTVTGGYDTGDWSSPDLYPTTLDAQGQGLGIIVEGSGITVSLQGLTLLNTKGKNAGTVHVIEARLFMSRCKALSTTLSLEEGGLVYLEKSDGSVIEASHFEDSSDWGVYVTESPNLWVAQSVITGNNGGGLYFDSYSGRVTATVQENHISHNLGDGILFERDNDYVRVLSNTIVGNGPEGSFALSGRGMDFAAENQDIEVRNNLVRGNKREGVYFGSGYGDVALAYNTVVSNGTSGSAGYYGVYLGSRGDTAVLTGNVITDNVRGGLYLGVFNKNHTLVDNFIVKNLGDGIVFDQSQANTMINNVVAENGISGIRVGNRRAAADSELTLLHNTIAHNAQEGVVAEKRAVVTLTNNILANHVVGLLTAHPGAIAEAEHTLWYGNEGNVGGLGIITRTADYYGNPNFVGGDVFTQTYNIQIGSAAIDIGATMSVVRDIEGRMRAPDAGAYEYPYALQLTPNRRKILDVQPQTVDYAHTLRNSGSTTQTFTLAAKTQTWTGASWVHTLTVKRPGEPAAQVQAGDGITLAQGASAQVTLTLQIPGDVEDVGRTVVTATSTYSTAIWKRVKDITQVGIGVEVDGGQQRDDVTPGTVLTYTHIVTNSGKSEVDFDLSLSSTYGWAELLTPTPLTLGDNESTLVQIRVAVPVTAGHVVETLAFTATHPAIRDVYATVLDTTTVKALTGTRYVALTGRVDAANSCLYTTYPCRTVGQAASQALSGEEIWVARGVYTDAQTASRGAIVKLQRGGIVIRGGYDAQNWLALPTADPRLTVLDAQHKGQVVDVRRASDPLTITGITLRHGREGDVYAQLSPMVVTNCIVSGAAPGYGIYLNESDNAIIQRSRVLDNADHGIYLYVSEALRMENSIVAENAGFGIVLEGVDNTNESQGDFYYNTIANNFSNSITGSVGVRALTSTVKMYNTIIAHQDQGISVTYEGETYVARTSYTLWYSVTQKRKGSGATQFYVRDDYEDDPRFAPSLDVLRDYHLIEGSAAQGEAGEDFVEIDVDIDGEQRDPDTPDIGADEILASAILDKQTEADIVPAGESLIYTLVLTNTGGLTLTANIFDDLPDHVQPGTIGPWTNQIVPPFTVWTKVVEVVPDLGYVGDLVNSAQAEASGITRQEDVITVTVGAFAGLEWAPDWNRMVNTTTVVYAHTLTNTGTVQDVFSLTHHSSQGWAVAYSQNPVTLTYRGESGSVATIFITLTMPSGTPVGTVDVTQVTATSELDPEVYAAAVDTTTVGTIPALEFSSEARAQSVDPPAVLTYTFTFTNTGNGPDTFALSAGSSQGWDVVIGSTSSGVLAVGQSTTVVFTLTVPIGSGGLVDTLTFTATSQANASVYNTAQATTQVNHAPDVELGVSQEKSAWAGRVFSYTHILTNTGNGPDTFDLSHSSSRGWTVNYATPVAVGYNQTQTVIVYVTVPTGTEGLEDVLMITATSQADASVVAVVTDTTTVILVDFEVTPLVLDTAVPPDVQATESLTITNTGNFALTWALSGTLPAWMPTVVPTGRVVATAGQASVDVTFDSTGLTGDLYTTLLHIVSQDDVSVAQSVPVTMTICQPATAQNIQVSSSAPAVGERVYFTATAQGTLPLTYTWDFDDTTISETGTTAQAQHVYGAADTYEVQVTVSNVCGGQHYTDVLTQALTVGAAGVPNLVVDLTPTYNVLVNQQVSVPLWMYNTGDADLMITGVMTDDMVTWLNVLSWPPVITPGGVLSATLSFDASGLSGGSTYTTTLTVSSNDPDGDSGVRVTLNVSNAQVYLPLVIRK